MGCVNRQNPECPNCNKSGLAILPVRYAVVPTAIAASLPPSLGNRVTEVKLAHHKYVLRTLRQGYVYIFHEKHPRGSQIKWEIYSVSTRGTLWKQQSTEAIESVGDDPACSRQGHNIPASLIAIEKPENCGKIWIAFSEHAWSEETFKLFASDVRRRDRRMQCFLPATWIASHNYKHGLAGTQTNVEQIIEYQDGFAPSNLVGGQTGKISSRDGTYDTSQLKKSTTRHAMAMRKRQSKEVANTMKAIGQRPDGKNNLPIIVALWDAVGITHELNGFRNDAGGRIEQYFDERALEIAAVNQIEGIRIALESRAGKAARRNAEAEVFQWSPSQSVDRLHNYSIQHPADTAGWNRQADLCARWEKDSEQKVPIHVASDRELFTRLPKKEWEMRMSEIDKSATRALSATTWDGSKTVAQAREENAQRAEKYAVATAWEKYEDLLVGGSNGNSAYKEFKSKYELFLSAADKVISERTDDLIAWLKSKSFLDALIEFDGGHINDSIGFNDTIGTAVFGINSSTNGKKQIDEWVREMRATEGNLLWRAIGLNNVDGIAELNDALQEAEKHREERTLAAAINWINYGNKAFKAFADTYKKCVSVNNANTTASSKAGSKAFGVKLRGYNLHQADKIVMTMGDSVFKHMRINNLADHASEKIIQHIFSIRAFVDPGDSLRLIVVQAQNETEARGQLLRRFRAAKTFLAPGGVGLQTPQAQNLTKAWNDFKENNSKGAASAVKDARLALLVMLIEGSNFAKLMADCKTKGDSKSWWLLAGSGMSITSALFDIASVPAKNLFGADSWSYQRLKGWGGIFSAAGTAVTAIYDVVDTEKAYGKGQYGLAILYFIKAAFGGANFALTAATTFTYAAPMIGRVTGNAAIGTAARVVGTRAATIIGTRILFMAAGAWLTAGAFGIQVLIWIFSDNELENWCSLSAFGKNRTAREAYKTVVEQSTALEKSLIEVGLSHD